MRELAFRIPVQISASPGATSPNPGAAGVIAWSTTSSTLVTWDGAQWVLADLAPADHRVIERAIVPRAQPTLAGNLT